MAKHYIFGTGNVYVVPPVGAPIGVMALQDVSVDFNAERKVLHGQNQFPLDTARGKASIEGSATYGQMNPYVANALFFGQTIATGETLQAFNEAASVPGTPYQVTVANAATFTRDLGVYNASTGNPLVRVASGPITGQYSVNEATGVYTFAAADTLTAMVFNYLYASASTGLTMTGSNLQMGDIPSFMLILSNKTKTKSSVLTLFSCTSSKLAFPFKQDDYLLPNFDFAAQDDGTGRVFSWSQTGG